jgi:selenocysteine lyase/cysteine desulfurase
VRRAFAPAAGSIYLDAATYGLPPRPTVTAMRRMLSRWQSGRGDWREDWDGCADAARGDFAALLGAPAGSVSLIPAASVGVGLIAATLRAGDEVVVPDDEFTSVLFPLLVARQEHGAAVRAVPFERLPEAIRPGTRLVATSLVQSQSGRVAPLDRLAAAAAAHGALVLLDVTQALPFVPLGPWLDRVDYVVCAAYKHLLCPRGTGFLYVRPERRESLPALFAGWRAADRPYERYYGGDLTLAPDGARFDVSAAWIAWVGAAESLRLLNRWRGEGALEDVLALTRRLAGALGLPPPGASVLSVPVADAAAAAAALRAAGIRASVRAGAVRFSPHVYNSPRQVLAAARVVAPFVIPPREPAGGGRELSPR